VVVGQEQCAAVQAGDLVGYGQAQAVAFANRALHAVKAL
jgi:hypothetical protein